MTAPYELLSTAAMTLAGTQQYIRLAGADMRERPEDAIERLTAAIVQLEQIRHAAIYLARDRGSSWEAIGQRTGLNARTAEQRWSNVDFRP